MKIALVHDYIKEYGGAERVLEALHEIFPRAPVFTTVYLPEFLGPHRDRFRRWNICPSWLQNIPFKEKLISIFRIIAPLVFRAWDFAKYDVVFVSATGAYTPNIIKIRNPCPSGRRAKSEIRNPIHICYCHTPPRYLYGYPTAREWSKNPVLRALSLVANHFLRLVDYKAAQNVDYFVANSENVAGRIKKFYRRDATVIYPPVDIPSINHKPLAINHRSYFLAGGRLARPKGIDLAILACTELHLPVKIFGKEFAGYGDELRTIAGSTIKFLGEVTEEEKWRLMRGAKAFIFPAEEEDFGITPVEAMMAGTPVIALRSGGVLESVRPGRTGIFFEEPTIDALVDALKQFETKRWDYQAIAKHAQKFSKERFKHEIKNFVNSKIKNKNSVTYTKT